MSFMLHIYIYILYHKFFKGPSGCQWRVRGGGGSLGCGSEGVRGAGGLLGRGQGRLVEMVMPRSGGGLPRMDGWTLGCSGDADPGLTPELAVGARERGTQDFDSWGFGPRTWEEGGTRH